MPDIQDQLRLEDDLVLQGQLRYREITEKAESNDRGSDTGYGQRLLKSLIEPVAGGIIMFNDAKGSNALGKYRKILKELDPYVISYIGLKCTLDALSSDRTVASVAMSIGGMIEDELRFGAFKELNPKYYTHLVRDLNKKNTRSYRHIRNALSVTSRRKGMEWNDWGKEVRAKVGLVILRTIHQYTDLIDIQRKRRGSKTINYVVPTEDAINWISNYMDHMSLLKPVTKPCIIQPDEWTGIRNGGYWSEPMRHRVPLVKGMSKEAEVFINDHDLDRVYTAVNAIQNTPWRVNTQVLDALIHCWQHGIDIGLPSKTPITVPQYADYKDPKTMNESELAAYTEWKKEAAKLYTDEASRVGRVFEVSRVISMAQEYTKYDSFWFVYQCCTRGRVYASTTGLSPQGASYNKALLEFSNGVPLGTDGFKWLALHGAACFGIDKVSHEDRLQWVNENERFIIHAGENPLDSISFWTDADKPLMFLAFCIDYAKAIHDKTGYVSHLPIGKDGSCNGLQHFSALLRDLTGATATNLVSGSAPADIYQEVSDVACKRVLEDTETPIRSEWLDYIHKEGKLTRKLSKRSVMTLPYGCTKYSCLSFVEEAICDEIPNYFSDNGRAARYLANHVWAGIGEVVQSATVAMEWLQSISDHMSSKDLPVWWVTPIGFPVFQDKRKQKQVRVTTEIAGKIWLSLNEPTDKLCSRTQRQSIAPNFVHSLDASHMMLTILESLDNGITDFAMIHDDFGTHAGNITKFNSIIRETFIDMYDDYNPLDDLRLTCALLSEDDAISEVPQTGNLDINVVRNSPYFFD